MVTGGAGVLCDSVCRALAQAGAKVAVLDLRVDSAESLAAELGSNTIGVACNGWTGPASRRQHKK